MGRRAKSELLDLTERIIRLYTEQHFTISEIEELLRQEGYDISRESIRRSVKTSKKVAQEFKKSIEEAKVLIDAVRANPNTDVIEATANLLGQRVFEFMRSVEAIDFDDPVGLSIAINKLASAQTQIAKLRLDFQKGFDAAKKAVLRSLEEELKAHPDLLERIAAVVAGVEARP